MLAVYHIEQADGSCIATCPSYPGWALHSNSPRDSHRAVEDSLTEYIVDTTSFAHYDVPRSNAELRSAA